MNLIWPATWSRWPHLYESMRGEDSPNMEGWICHWPGTPGAQTIGDDPDDELAAIRSYERYHVETKGWRAVAYDYMVGQSGRVYVGRGTGRSAATSGDFDEDGVPNNTETDGVLFVVGLSEPVSPAAIGSFVELVDSLGGPRDYILPHRQASTPRECPGEHVIAQVTVPAQNWPRFRRTVTTEELTMADITDITDRLDEIEGKVDNANRRLDSLPRDVWDDPHPHAPYKGKKPKAWQVLNRIRVADEVTRRRVIAAVKADIDRATAEGGTPDDIATVVLRRLSQELGDDDRTD